MGGGCTGFCCQDPQPEFFAIRKARRHSNNPRYKRNRQVGTVWTPLTKRCRTCELPIECLDEDDYNKTLRCPCCKLIFRINPSNKKDKAVLRELRERTRMEKEVPILLNSQ